MDATTLHEDADAATAIVIVTYGKRLELLRRTVGAFDGDDRVARIVIVDNGSVEPITPANLGASRPVSVIRIDGNIGSAGGFSVGIAAALALPGITYLAILDDDNLGEPGYLETLIGLHRDAGGSDDIAFVALRSDRPHYRDLLADPARAEHRANSFLGFHLLDVPRRLLRRLTGAGTATPAAPVRMRAVRSAPYGGLFLTMAAARRVGAPRADFVLYGDDHEYTRRLVDSGVTLLLTDHARIEDIDQSWNLVASAGSRWVDADAPAWRIYYAARNHVFLERTDRGVSRLIHSLNGRIFAARLFAEALARHRDVGKASAVLGPFRHAVADAAAGRLGARDDYPIPGWNAEAARTATTARP